MSSFESDYGIQTRARRKSYTPFFVFNKKSMMSFPKKHGDYTKLHEAVTRHDMKSCCSVYNQKQLNKAVVALTLLSC